MTNIDDTYVLVGRNGHGSFVAATVQSPYFCFEGGSEKEVLDRASRALAFVAKTEAPKRSVATEQTLVLRSFVAEKRLRIQDLAAAMA